MSTQEDIINKYGAALSMSTSITHRDMGAVDLALRLAVQDASRVVAPHREPWRDYEAELLTIHRWIEEQAPWASRPNTTVADDAVALMIKQKDEIERLRADFEVEASALRVSMAEQDLVVQNLRKEVNRQQVLLQTGGNNEPV